MGSDYAKQLFDVFTRVLCFCIMGLLCSSALTNYAWSCTGLQPITGHNSTPPDHKNSPANPHTHCVTANPHTVSRRTVPVYEWGTKYSGCSTIFPNAHRHRLPLAFISNLWMIRLSDLFDETNVMNFEENFRRTKTQNPPSITTIFTPDTKILPV